MISKDTQAYIGAGAVDRRQGDGCGRPHRHLHRRDEPGRLRDHEHFKGLAVQASSFEGLFGLAITAGGGFVGVSTAVEVEVLTATTLAYIGDGAQINLALGAGGSQDVNVTAVARTKAFSFAGGIGAGLVGVGGAVDIGVMRLSTQAWIGDGSTVHAADDVDVNALAIKDIVTLALSIGGGFVGVSGSVSVWTVGTTGSGAYDDGTQGTDRGVWAAGVLYHENDIVTGSDGIKYAARSEHTSTPADNPVLRDASDPSKLDSNAADKWGRIGADTLKTDAPAWQSGTDYDENDIVRGSDGNFYQARVDHASAGSTDPTLNTPASNAKWRPASDGPAEDAGNQASGGDSTNGFQGILSGTSSGSGNRTDQRIGDNTGGANSSIASSAPGSDVVSNAVAAPPAGGTTARIGAGVTVVAGGSVSVRADERLDLFSIVGGVQGGFVAVGASVLVANVETNVDASIGANASITAGAGAGDA